MPTFCSTAFSSEWTRICSFLRLAWKARASAWALLRTCAISSLALDKRGWLRLPSDCAPPRLSAQGAHASQPQLLLCLGLQRLVPLAFLLHPDYVILNTLLQ